MYRSIPPTLALAALLVAATACGDDAADAAATPRAELTAPTDGARIAGAVDVTMSASGVTIGPAGEVVPGTGHFHVIADRGCVAAGEPIGKDADQVHFGTGASTGTIYLEPGRHSLCLQVGDGAHTALAITDVVDIDVAIRSRDEWCGVVADTDSLFAALDASTDTFAVQQAGFENVRRLLAQLEDGITNVDAEAREPVGELIRWGIVLVETMLAAESEAAAAEQLWGPESVLPSDAELGDAGAAWVRTTCGVSLD